MDLETKRAIRLRLHKEGGLEVEHSKHPIENVSDTAFWVAHYRAVETDRPDALFRDPLAKVLLDERAQKIAESMKKTGAYTQHNVVIRTVIIDRFIQELVSRGVDTVLNLGSGLDTRPYRLNLPADLRWIEVDYPALQEFKTDRLEGQSARVALERVSLDLADREKRKALFQELGARGRNILVMTEGVLPYLTPDQVSELCEDLSAQKNFHYWIADYISPLVYPYVRSKDRLEKMKNAPFQFFPDDWFGFFRSRGWVSEKIDYIPEFSVQIGRRMPRPWWSIVMGVFMGAKMRAVWMKASGYMIMVRTKG